MTTTAPKGGRPRRGDVVTLDPLLPPTYAPHHRGPRRDYTPTADDVFAATVVIGTSLRLRGVVPVYAAETVPVPHLHPAAMSPRQACDEWLSGLSDPQRRELGRLLHFRLVSQDACLVGPPGRWSRFFNSPEDHAAAVAAWSATAAEREKTLTYAAAVCADWIEENAGDRRWSGSLSTYEHRERLDDVPFDVTFYVGGEAKHYDHGGVAQSRVASVTQRAIVFVVPTAVPAVRRATRPASRRYDLFTFARQTRAIFALEIPR